jgi:hypothetical protein
MSTFHPFSRLPVELRTYIWRLGTDPRIVDIRISQEADGSKFRIAPPLTPPCLQACQESRTELSRFYQRAFSELSSSLGTGYRYFWVDFDIDTLDIGDSAFMLYKAVAPMIKRLKIKGRNSDPIYYHEQIRRIRIFTNVKEIQVVCADGVDNWSGAIAEHFWPCGVQNVWYIEPNDGTIIRAVDFG